MPDNEHKDMHEPHDPMMDKKIGGELDTAALAREAMMLWMQTGLEQWYLSECKIAIEAYEDEKHLDADDDPDSMVGWDSMIKDAKLALGAEAPVVVEPLGKQLDYTASRAQGDTVVHDNKYLFLFHRMVMNGNKPSGFINADIEGVITKRPDGTAFLASSGFRNPVEAEISPKIASRLSRLTQIGAAMREQIYPDFDDPEVPKDIKSAEEFLESIT